MGNIRSAKKRTRQSVKRTEVNRARKSNVRNQIRNVEQAIAAGDKKAAQTAFRAAQPDMMRGALKKVVHKNAMSRKLSRLSAHIKRLP